MKVGDRRACFNELDPISKAKPQIEVVVEKRMIDGQVRQVVFQVVFPENFPGKVSDDQPIVFGTYEQVIPRFCNGIYKVFA
ncbi:hypothetical protein D3C86_1606070 [compost metagenome]